MKESQVYLGLIALFFASFFLASCLNEDNKIPENCYDGILNNGEELIDCGGPNCPLCDPCENFVWEPELGEQWVDCGGECDPCDPSFNGQLDPGEEGIDCGGDTGVDCGELCGDGLLNGNEEEIDCGGPDCDPCPTCTDGILNQDETGIDCGGSECPDCPEEAGDCTNGEIDGDEQYIDCGGSACPPCEGLITFKRGGQTIVCDASVMGALAGGTITLTGASLLPAGISFTLAEPDLGWTSGVGITADVASNPATVIQFTDNTGVIYSTAFGEGEVSLTIDYVLAEAGGFIAGSFSGQLYTADGEESVFLTQGQFAVPLP
ncbi:hypothetical protein [Sanyastnella coralliicola]|uniref:hypothetical protein n=1 Tax=Sanyastnella coralliicola TaxID=3069118 RepID=UPI0027BAB9FA|nr:hypothetical protein [Longitalea sp. SCSIO 12813]